MTAADVVNDGAKVARVRIDGTVNGKFFTVERSTRRCANLAAPVDLLGNVLRLEATRHPHSALLRVTLTSCRLKAGRAGQHAVVSCRGCLRRMNA